MSRCSFPGNGNVVHRVVAGPMTIIDISEGPIDSPNHKPATQPGITDRMDQYLTAQCPFPSVTANLNIDESGLLQKKSKTVFREPKKIVGLLVQGPVHWAG